MRLEKKNEQELAKRKGLTTRTILQVVWLVLSGIIVYFIVQALFDAQILTYSFFYSSLSVPGWVPQEAIIATLILVGIVIMQFFFIFGYLITSPEGRAPTGKPTVHSRDPDPLEDRYRH